MMIETRLGEMMTEEKTGEIKKGDRAEEKATERRGMTTGGMIRG